MTAPVRRISRARRRAGVAECRAGMSLVEMAVVIIVIGLIAVIMMPLTADVFLSLSDTKKAKQLAVLLDHARNTAISRNADITLEFELSSDPDESDAYTGYVMDRESDSAEKKVIFERTSIHLGGIRSVGSPLIDKGKVQLVFLPSGVSEQAWFYVGDREDQPEAVVVLDRYLGTARVFEDPAAMQKWQDADLKDDSWHHDQN
ncbi:MAG: GspH/FimT family pseudopilin [Leptospiraceae bacterium]|nr:GspH/FimT family pseudopilin [Leptospiraceae bacterium]